MYEKLFVFEATIVRHQSAPFFQERKRYVQHCAEEGYSQSTLLRIARQLFWIAKRFQAKLSSHQDITSEEIEKAANQWARQQYRHGRAKTYKWPREHFIQQANQWFRFLGCLQDPAPNPVPFKTLIEDFATFMDYERGLSPVTIQNRCWHVKQFLSWYRPTEVLFYQFRLKMLICFLHIRSTSPELLLQLQPKHFEHFLGMPRCEDGAIL